jgi:hypothetical protein
LLALATFVVSTTAAASPAYLAVGLWIHAKGSHDVQLRVINTGDTPAPATTLQVETLPPGSNSPTGGKAVSVPALGPSNATFYPTYQLPQACASGLRVRATVDFDADPTPEDNVLVAYPCQADLRVRFQAQLSDQDLEFTVDNLGGEAAPATSIHFQSLTTPPSDPSDVAISALGPGQSDTAVYHLTAPCAGLEVQADVSPSQEGKGSIQLYPCGSNLKISFDRYIDVNKDMAFDVTNLGGQDAPATKVIIEKLPQQALPLPAPTPVAVNPDAREFDVPALKPSARFGFTYNLGSGLCPAGLQVRATIATDDTNPGDNSVTVQVCADNRRIAPQLQLSQKLTKPDFTDIERRTVGAPQPDPANYVVHPAWAPSEHTLDFDPAVLNSRAVQDERGLCRAFPSGDKVGQVGWLQVLGPRDLVCTALGGGGATEVAQTAVRFEHQSPRAILAAAGRLAEGESSS